MFANRLSQFLLEFRFLTIRPTIRPAIRLTIQRPTWPDSPGKVFEAFPKTFTQRQTLEEV